MFTLPWQQVGLSAILAGFSTFDQLSGASFAIDGPMESLYVILVDPLFLDSADIPKVGKGVFAILDPRYCALNLLHDVLTFLRS